jgi:hypothetical protein
MDRYRHRLLTPLFTYIANGDSDLNVTSEQQQQITTSTVIPLIPQQAAETFGK